MQKLIYQFNISKNRYECTESSDSDIWLLERFLNDLSLVHIPVYTRWSSNIQSKSISGNDIILKKENHNVLIGSLFSDEPDEGPYFGVSIDQFVKLLEEWKKLVKNKTPIISITEQDGIITIKGDNAKINSPE